ncbi:hypothetical protein SAMN02949497_0843 [Methylomagnum ishizawai]|uniref:ABC-type transport auxiliary lipoprotein component domain-containing protein n=1 Tax=Methylomagnum ishizawai TaxID=1760988 RepID=A0A1Y6CTB9_9GAMM|nr:PqiC family protein [Methylomagnum ishizawai]SMF93556.1 hypothetical protein SAMN02949497_0843 [Methylomagnum ishizawai]
MRRSFLILAYAVLLSAAGCGSTPPTRFYTLAPLQASGAKAEAAGLGLALGLGPVELPKSMDRPQIVTRSGANELQLAEFDRWAEPVQDNVVQVLAENLSLLLPGQKVVIYPWNRSQEIDYQVAVRVVRYDRADSGDVVLKARWSVSSPTNDNELLAREASYTAHPAGPDYRATVEAMNHALNDLSRDVAAAVKGLRGAPL